jgi:quercetin dioxygenase-like cupin family protein
VTAHREFVRAPCAPRFDEIIMKEKNMSKTGFPALKRDPLFEEALPEANPPVRVVKGARIRFEPGQPSGLHRHPISTCGVVTEGNLNFQRKGEEPRVLKPGDAFFEPADHVMLQFDNASSTEPAEIICFYLTDSGDRPAIEMLGSGMDQQLGKA